MNCIVLMGRLTREPEIRYSQGTNNAVAKYSLAVDRRFKREGEPDADFFNIVSFGKQGEFVEKYLHKGTKVVLRGELRNNNYTNKDGQMVYSTNIVTDSVEFAESKGSGNTLQSEPHPQPKNDGFMNMTFSDQEELPFV